MKQLTDLYNACEKAVEYFADKQVSEASEHNCPISTSDAKGYATDISDNEAIFKALDALIEQIIEDKYDDMIDGKLSEESSARAIEETETFNRINKL